MIGPDTSGPPPIPAGLPTPDQLNTMPWGQLISLRNAHAQDQAAQDYLAPYEHQAYARETTRESPILGGLQMAVLTPAYTAVKGLGIINAARALGLVEDDGTKQSSASWGELGAGFKGIGQGWGQSLRGLLRN